MRKERVTDKEAIVLIITFVFGTALVIGASSGAKNDAWLAGIAGLIMVIPMLLVYSRILSLFHEKGLFDILSLIFGKITSRIIAAIYFLYSFHLGSLVLRNFGEFINTVAMTETPMLFPMLCIGSVCIIGARLGVEVLGRTTTYFLPIIFFILLLVQLLGMSELKLNFLKPIMGNGLGPILQGGFSTFSFPFAETVLFMGGFASLKTKKSPYKIYFLGMLISGSILVMITIRNIGVLGNMLGSFYFPSYAAVSRISIGDFLQRIEVTVSFVLIYCVVIKCSICLIVACKGIAKIFSLDDYRSIAIQTGLLMIYFAYTIYDNSMEMKYWAFKVYSYYAFPMQVILPIVIWIFAEISARKNKPSSPDETRPTIP